MTGDAGYGSAYSFRAALERRGLGYVLGVRADQAVCVGWRQIRVKALLAEAPAAGWQRLGRGAGSKGPRVYDWAACPVNAPDPRRYARWPLVRRGVADPTGLAYFPRGGPPRTPLAEPVRVAGARWAIEECFDLAKGDCGLDEYEVRSWVGWHRHVTLGPWAAAAAAVVRARVATTRRQKGARVWSG